jgi:hypothetical protein
MLVFCLLSISAQSQACSNVRHFDFKNVTIHTAPSDDGSRQGSETFHLRDGITFISDDPDSLESHDWKVELLEDHAVHPDPLTWIRVIVLERDHLTGTGTWHYILAFSCQEGHLVRLFQYSSTGVNLMHLDDQSLQLYQAIRAPTDSYANPSRHSVLSYKWNAKEHRYLRADPVARDDSKSKPDEK